MSRPASPYLRGFSDDCVIPVSRWTEMRQSEIDAASGLNTLLFSDEVGPCLVEDPAHRALYIFNHLEYDSDTLKQEYDRDVSAGAPINVPCNYYPGDDPSQAAAEPLAQPRAPALRQLDFRDLRDHAIRYRENWAGTYRPAGLSP